MRQPGDDNIVLGHSLALGENPQSKCRASQNGCSGLHPEQVGAKGAFEVEVVVPSGGWF